LIQAVQVDRVRQAERVDRAGVRQAERVDRAG
jgi:hypothetical protein